MPYQEKRSPDYVRGSCRHTPNSQVLDPAIKTRADTGVTPDCPLAEDSDDVSITNSEVESAMGHRRRRAILRDPSFTKEAFNSFSSAYAYIRTARDGLTRAADQHLKDMRVGLLYKTDNYIPVAPET